MVDPYGTVNRHKHMYRHFNLKVALIDVGSKGVTKALCFVRIVDLFCKFFMRRFLKRQSSGGSDNDCRPKAQSVQCPACHCPVALCKVNEHLDSGECKPGFRAELPSGVISLLDDDDDHDDHNDDDRDGAHVSPTAVAKQLPATRQRSELLAEEHPELKGQFLIYNFISEDEEGALLSYLEGSSYEWEEGYFNGPAFRKRWGVETDLKLRKFKPPTRQMPEEFFYVAERMREIRHRTSFGLKKLIPEFRPNEANAIDYRKELGHHLTAHCDDRQLSGKVLCNLCLAGDAVMTYLEDRPSKSSNRRTFRITLPRRSLEVRSGNVRYNFQHSIAANDVLSERRVSITFRQNICPGYHI
eukprot:TRINITY_DN20944_c0_g1_i1.p1 TRINITY_DN20944_c0_g1~~TRINITY_DN20944_c0_g1_i1.p1  ORF type:complete len:356 (+),score=41.46 TRINITY_DN20944_c0_g1_i1:51-1118(+)